MYRDRAKKEAFLLTYCGPERGDGSFTTSTRFANVSSAQENDDSVSGLSVQVTHTDVPQGSQALVATSCGVKSLKRQQTDRSYCLPMTHRFFVTVAKEEDTCRVSLWD